MPRTSPEPVGGFHHPVHITFADSNDAYSDHREILIKLSDNITSFTIFIKWCVIVERFSAPPRHRLLVCSNFVNGDLMIRYSHYSHTSTIFHENITIVSRDTLKDNPNIIIF